MHASNCYPAKTFGGFRGNDAIEVNYKYEINSCNPICEGRERNPTKWLNESAADRICDMSDTTASGSIQLLPRLIMSSAVQGHFARPLDYPHAILQTDVVNRDASSSLIVVLSSIPNSCSERASGTSNARCYLSSIATYERSTKWRIPSSTSSKAHG